VREVIFAVGEALEGDYVARALGAQSSRRPTISRPLRERSVATSASLIGLR
jgi:hypothetical protein